MDEKKKRKSNNEKQKKVTIIKFEPILGYWKTAKNRTETMARRSKMAASRQCRRSTRPTRVLNSRKQSGTVKVLQTELSNPMEMTMGRQVQ